MGRNTKEEAEKLKKMEQAILKKQQEQASPVRVAYAIEKEPGTGWVFVEYEIKNDKVVNKKMKECMDKDHAIEVYKISFVTKFIEGR
jgi:hypothetical protein